jgi:hypothetical protein
MVQVGLSGGAEVGQNRTQADHLGSDGGKPDRAHEQDSGENSQDALRVHMNNFSDLRLEYNPATKSP